MIEDRDDLDQFSNGREMQASEPRTLGDIDPLRNQTRRVRAHMPRHRGRGRATGRRRSRRGMRGKL
jgi:hypothetical protein